MAGSHFQTLDVSSVQRMLIQLHEEVARSKGRVEVTRPDSGETCVIISKAELESLERALEILADGDGVKALCASLSTLAMAAHANPL